MENDPIIFDPYSRPPDRLNEVEPMILGAAFSAGSVTEAGGGTTGALNGAEQGRMVPVVPGVPVLVSRNTKSEVLVVTVQTNLYGNIFGRFGKGPDYLTPNSAPFNFVLAGPFSRTLRQILLAKEELWAVIDDTGPIPATPTHLIVSEVTP